MHWITLVAAKRIVDFGIRCTWSVVSAYSAHSAQHDTNNINGIGLTALCVRVGSILIIFYFYLL